MLSSIEYRQPAESQRSGYAHKHMLLRRCTCSSASVAVDECDHAALFGHQNIDVCLYYVLLVRLYSELLLSFYPRHTYTTIRMVVSKSSSGIEQYTSIYNIYTAYYSVNGESKRA